MGNEFPNEASLSVCANSAVSVTFKWPQLVAPQVLSPRSLSPAGHPELAYRVDVSQRLSHGSLQHRTTVLLDEWEEQAGVPTEASVFHLLPATEYHAELLIRFSRLGTRRWQSTGLSASFV